MKYSSLKQGNMKSVQISSLESGIKLSGNEKDLSESVIKDFQNVVFENGVLKTRKGLSVNLQNILDTSFVEGSEKYSFYLTDTEVFWNGEYRKIAVADIDYDNLSHHYIFVYLIGSNCEVTNLGFIHFGRLDGSVYFVPENITFYVGEPQEGAGIFALVTLSNMENPEQKTHYFYELNNDLQRWNMGMSYYIPTVYINGRGNMFDLANAEVGVYDAKPMMLEKPNLLKGTFYAYYTSDGYSTSFRLPYTEIDYSRVICRIHYNLTTYVEWVLEEEQSSVTESFYGSDVTMNIDRESGTVFFTGMGGDFAIPRMSMYSENNIRFMASKEIESSFENIVSCKCVAEMGSKLIFAGGKDKNKFFVTSYQNPLYFPQLSANEIGSQDAEVTALGVSNGKVYAFKSDEIYSLALKEGKSLNTTSLLADNGTLFSENDSFDIKCINSGLGCRNKNTLKIVKNYPIWQAGDGNIYRMNNSSGAATKISYDIEPFLNELTYDEISSAFGGVIGDRYILTFDSRVIVADLTDGTNTAFHFWKFPEASAIRGIFSNRNKLVLLCHNVTDEIAYTASLDGEYDAVLTASGEVRHPIESVISFKKLYFGSKSRKKRVKNIVLWLYSKGEAEIKVGNEREYSKFSLYKSDFTGEEPNTVRLITDFKALRELDIEIKSKSDISFAGADIYFKESKI